MGDPLLDEATRVADAYQREIPSGISPIADLLRALVERVQAAEAERDMLGNAAFAGYCAAGGDTDSARNWAEFFRPLTYPIWSEVVEREVRQAIRDEENEAENQAGIATIRTAERDEARGKLDAIDAVLGGEPVGWDDRKQLADIWQRHARLPEEGLSDAVYAALIAVANYRAQDIRDVLAIIDGKAPVRPVDSRSATPGVPGPDAP